ncbi:MAG: MOSC N-terminal beta barrel domain-containing protein [Cellvibrionaceae bacterium]|nr:MOSC N-terminal beta barrel domain-containing protein [Cellvibrionaceae bacterium]
MIIAELYVYPIKSCAGQAVESATLGAQGFSGDRQWMLVDANGRFVSQRQFPKMALIQAKPLRDALLLSAPGVEDIVLNDIPENAATLEVEIWNDRCRAQVAQAEVNQWFSDFLKSSQHLRLVRYHPEEPRWPYQPERFGENNAKFADAAPFLVTNRASLTALNAALKSSALPTVSMARFRPNIVIDGPAAFSEHRLQYLDVGAAQLKMVDPCARCAIITIDPDTGEKTPSRVPFQQLAALNPMPQQAKLPAFGVNACIHGKTSLENSLLKVGQNIAGR